MNNLVKPFIKPDFRTIPLYIHSDEMIKKVSGYSYYISTYGRLFNKRLKCLKPGIRCGYQYVNLYKNGKGKMYKIHRLVAQSFIENPENKTIVDHIDRNPLNNHYTNLRYVTASENQMNKSKQTNNTSGFTGVIWYKSRDKWRAQIMVDMKKIHLGYYSKISEAIASRKSAEIKYFGDYRAK
jgi:hypothetical protein